ncbi:3-methylmercaptopropionyl-CoA dehydrogenase [Beijerinckiaceae bacterium RH AL1]|nr:acyl-CoA dehydrogenase C-terminal domain-containing protein [Beijerinckiaceae bacterium]VVB43144.1 3-methylmercaptopropionyl-CoA dehydrogenase [Beijerinckiaceae bacterium RH AL8]VVB43159.1 3-methylmercaptopropionyl-CoA dehydrogenase [Beijerinckiaceae bacterium RH CH11]VVC53692.1 3-methylmercaptopropionyl-CoA dehydrogenase [Beijerinckiaceae bacterium RH AL1]
MQTYKAPLRDMRFILQEMYGTQELTEKLGFEDASDDLCETILEEAAKLAEEVLLPLNATGDAEGCHYENGVVRTPKGFPEAYNVFREGGWTSLNADPKYGGQGLPESLAKLVEEMLCSANMAFGLYPGLTHGATIAIEKHASQELKDRFLPKMVDGTWGGTMCLTEAHCGTDLGMLRTKAVPQPDGSYALTGSKIFISSGDHDLTENIIHLVLARLPDAPKGVKGISLFLVPKLIPSDDGRPGQRNGVTCAGIEHKMGIKASATCQINFEDAKGWMVGPPNKGMQGMFSMMNSERLSVGIQGLGIAEASYQSAVAYAKDRIQGRSLSGAKAKDRAADPIIVHPDVRRNLMRMRAEIEGCRALSGWVARALDRSEKANDPQVRQEAEDFLALMTPIVKATFTDFAFENTNRGLQVYGGHGYIRDHGMEQYVRDARIAMIYEGTNGIQALDLVGRKLGAHAGRYLRAFFHPVATFIEENRNDEAVGEYVKRLEKAFGALQLATGQIAQSGMRDPEEAGAAATDYTRLFGLVALAYLWARMAKLAATKLPKANGDASFYKAKLATARFFFDRILPESAGLFAAIKSGKASLMEMEEAAF